MKQIAIWRITGVALIFIAMSVFVFWAQISEAFGPTKQHESQCLICQRYRTEKWVGRSKTIDAISTNIYSDWIDSITPADHQHVWLVDTVYERAHWFGSSSIGCGGTSVIPTIFEQRSRLGEIKTRELLAKFHELIKASSADVDLRELDSFQNAVNEDPESLLKSDFSK